MSNILCPKCAKNGKLTTHKWVVKKDIGNKTIVFCERCLLEKPKI